VLVPEEYISQEEHVKGVQADNCRAVKASASRKTHSLVGEDPRLAFN
jgi:hypothetical protein